MTRRMPTTWARAERDTPAYLHYPGEAGVVRYGEGTDLTLGVPLTNTGRRSGTEVVQVYVAPTDPHVHRPPKELAGFAKLSVEPGATERAKVQLNERSFARWDLASDDWVVDPGEYTLVVAASAADHRHEVPVAIS